MSNEATSSLAGAARGDVLGSQKATSPHPRGLGRQLRWMIGIRLVVITSVLLPYLLLLIASPGLGPGLSFLHVLAALTYTASLVYIWLLRALADRKEIQAYVQFFGDLLLITGMVYYFGGIASPFSILYLVVIIVASALLRRRAGFAVATVAWLLYCATSLAVYYQWIPLPSPETAGVGEPASIEALEQAALRSEPSQTQTIPLWRLLYNLVIHCFGFYVVSFLTSRLAQTVLRAERELEAKREDLADLQVVHRDVIESIPSGLITCDRNGEVTSVNLAAQEILGKAEAELLGRPMSRSGMFSEEEWRRLAADPEASRASRPELVYSRGEELRHIGYSLNPLVNAEGVGTGYILIFQDLSDWRKLQEEVRLKDRLAAVGEMASGIAHEIGNPLAAISGSVQMLATSLEGRTSQRKLLEIILKESQRLDRTVKSFLKFARPRERSSVRFDIAKLVRENFELLRNSSEVSSRHRLDLDLEPPSHSLIADPDQISQIFWNLARNALRAMPEGGTLRVAGDLDRDCYRIRFTDTGRGMSKEERRNLFHPYRSFFDQGSGIGMAIVYRIVEEHQGHLSVDSRPGEGTTITVELPTALVGSSARTAEA